MVCPENSTPGRLVHEIPWGQWEGGGIEKSAAGQVTQYAAAQSAAEVLLRKSGMRSWPSRAMRSNERRH
jgi:hypothetical protein